MTMPDRLVSLCIPARHGSSRFPGKPLALLAGKPLIQHVYEASHRVPNIGQTLVVTDHPDIVQSVHSFGGEAILVREPCRTGTDRVALVASELTYDIVVNLQADEIPLHPDFLGDLICPFLDSQAGMGTLKRPLSKKEDYNNPSIVKVVTDVGNQALYFSRSPIPYWRDGQPLSPSPLAFHHLGVYIFRKPELKRFSQLPTGYLEDLEKLEQLRALEHRLPIMVWETTHASIRIDEPSDLEAAEKLFIHDP